MGFNQVIMTRLKVEVEVMKKIKRKKKSAL